MSTTRKVISVFLASPGDLEPERRAAKSAVDEINETWANKQGYHVELVGWEDTIPGFGRPQELINQDLRRCELFIGMLWMRWGTPPDNTSSFSSGFEEEFRLSLKRREGEGTPEIKLFFKVVDTDRLTDPGDQLKKVRSFRKSVEEERKVLFQEFHDDRDLERRLRKTVSAYLLQLMSHDRAGDPVQAQSGGNTEEGRPDEKGQQKEAGEIQDFLNSLHHTAKEEHGLDALDNVSIARFRLIATSISQHGNDEVTIGVHDANLLYEFAGGISFSPREIQA
jgi:hypothetical protein